MTSFRSRACHRYLIPISHELADMPYVLSNQYGFVSEKRPSPPDGGDGLFSNTLTDLRKSDGAAGSPTKDGIPAAAIRCRKVRSRFPISLSASFTAQKCCMLCGCPKLISIFKSSMP